MYSYVRTIYYVFPDYFGHDVSGYLVFPVPSPYYRLRVGHLLDAQSLVQIRRGLGIDLGYLLWLWLCRNCLSVIVIFQDLSQ
jgi:hypothetical protein